MAEPDPNCLPPRHPSNSGVSSGVGRALSFSTSGVNSSGSTSLFDLEVSSVVNRNRSWVPDVVPDMKPTKGHVFGSLRQAHDFYAHYGKLGGFDIKLGTEKNYHSTEYPNIKYFHCSRGGKKKEAKYDSHSADVSNAKGKNIFVDKCAITNRKGKGIAVHINDKGKGIHVYGVVSDKGKSVDVNPNGVTNVDVSVGDSVSCKGGKLDVSVDDSASGKCGDTNYKRTPRKNKSSKTDCLARMFVRKLDGDLFEVYGFIEEHNHPLVSPDDRQFMLSSRELNFSKQQFLCQVSNTNVGPVRAFKLMKEMYGGFENIGATAVDCKNFKRDMNLFIGNRDAQMAVEKLENRAKMCGDFFVDYYQGEGGALCGLFWADKTAKRNYRRFGDVISFDATFRSNRYNMVFVPFTGIDNHNRSVTFGAGLLSDETVNSYKWLIQSFKKAFGTTPQVVVTDQDPSMKQAIETELPNSRHRYCMWHIMQKLLTKVGYAVCSQDDFKRRFCSIVWTDRISPELFDEQWVSIMREFDLVDHKWLSDLFAMRHRWIPAFLRDEDLSGLMRTTSRSESENSFFNRWTNHDLTLVEFLSHYDSTMYAQRYTQRKNDYESRVNRPDLRTGLKMEKDASKLYSLNVFYDVQEEIVASMNHCLSIGVEEIGRFEKYFIRDTDLKKWTDKHEFEVYEVVYGDDMSVTCSCRRFELYGLLCRHIFYVLRMNNVEEFPNEYLLDRWAKTEHNEWFDNSYEMCESSSAAGVRELRQIFENTVDRLVLFQDKMDDYKTDLLGLLTKAEEDVPVVKRVDRKEVFCTMLGVTEPVSVGIHVPRQSKNKGSGSRSRWKNADELVRNEVVASKKRRTCLRCGKAEGHNSRTCTNQPIDGSSSSRRPTRTTRSTDVDYRD